MTKYVKKTDKVYKKLNLRTPETLDSLVKDYGNRPNHGIIPLYEGKSVDKRGKVVHRFNRIFHNIESDLGGKDILSEGQRQIACQCAILSVIHEAFTQKFLENPDFMFQMNGRDRTNLDDYNKLVNTVSRLFKTIGLERRANDITDLSLRDYVTKYHSEDEEPE